MLRKLLQDAHEFLNYILNNMMEDIEASEEGRADRNRNNGTKKIDRSVKSSSTSKKDRCWLRELLSVEVGM